MERALAGLELSPCMCQSAYPAQICSATCAVGDRAKQRCLRDRDKCETGTGAKTLAALVSEAGLSATPIGVCLKLQHVLCKIDILNTQDKRASVTEADLDRVQEFLPTQYIHSCRQQAVTLG